MSESLTPAVAEALGWSNIMPVPEILNQPGRYAGDDPDGIRNWIPDYEHDLNWAITLVEGNPKFVCGRSAWNGGCWYVETGVNEYFYDTPARHFGDDLPQLICRAWLSWHAFVTKHPTLANGTVPGATQQGGDA